MDIKGVCYDVGRLYSSRFLTRRVFDPAMTRCELQIIRDDLRCNAVHFCSLLIRTEGSSSPKRGMTPKSQVWFTLRHSHQKRDSLPSILRMPIPHPSLGNCGRMNSDS